MISALVSRINALVSTEVDQPDCFPKSIRTYNQDGLITMHDCSFVEDPQFANAYSAARQTGSWRGPWGQANIHWRAHVLCWAASSASALNGDFVECGVDRGGTAMLVYRYVGLDKQPNRRFFLYDTFCGLDPNRSSDTERASYAGIYQECFDEVKDRFAKYPNVIVSRGSVPDTLLVRAPERVAYLHIDMNAAEPERAAIEFFWPRLVPGAFIVLDDYAWVSCHAQKVIMDEFAKSMNCTVLSLPTGQGILIKPLV